MVGWNEKSFVKCPLYVSFYAVINFENLTIVNDAGLNMYLLEK